MEQSTRSPGSRDRDRRFRLTRFLFPLFFAVFVLAILTDRIPALRDARERVLRPAEYQARAACHAAALQAAEQPTFARIVADGEVHATQGAQYVKGVRVGEMGPGGDEVTFGFSCYVDAEGDVVKTHKQASAPRAAN